MKQFYKEVDNSVICTLKDGEEVRYFIPENWFDTKSAMISGEYVSLLGCFCYALYDKNGKPMSELKTFYFPSIFTAQPYTIDKMKDVVLTKHSDKIDYRVLRFKEGDKLIVQTTVPQSIANVEELFRLFVITGNTPNTIDYRELHNYFLDCIKLSGNSWGLNNQLFGIFISKLCRDPEDYSRDFRVSKAKKNGEWTNYKVVSVSNIPKYASPYISLTSEVFDDALMSATMLDTATYSPMEKVFTGK